MTLATPTDTLDTDDHPVPYVLADLVTRRRLERDALVAQLRITLPPDHLRVLVDALAFYGEHLAAQPDRYEPDHLSAKRHAQHRRTTVIASLVERALGRTPR